MSHPLTQEDARAIARVLYAVHQRRAARLATEQDHALPAQDSPRERGGADA